MSIPGETYKILLKTPPEPVAGVDYEAPGCYGCGATDPDACTCQADLADLFDEDVPDDEAEFRRMQTEDWNRYGPGRR